MPTTGVLGSPFAALGSFTLGASPVQGDVVERTPGLVALWKCDDPVGSTFAAGINNLHAAHLTRGTVPFDQVPGVDDYAISTPTAPKTGDHVYDTARHLKFATTGGPVTLGDAGTIEIWFKPFEFADEIAPPPAPPGSDANRDYEILRVESTAQQYLIRFLAGWPSQFGAFGQLLRVNFTQAGFPGTPGVWDAFADAGRDGTGFLSYSGFYPPCEVGRWYYMAMAWDQTGYAMYLNGVKLPNWDTWTAHPPADLGDCDVSFGECGGLYDLISITNRRMTDAEVENRFDPGASAAPADTDVYLTTFMASYAAGFLSTARVTNQRAEVLRTGSRDARVSTARLEILRSVAAGSEITPVVAESLRFTETVSYTDTPAVPPKKVGGSDALAFTQTAAADVYAPHPVPVSARETLAFTQTARRVRSGTAADTLAVVPTARADVSKPARETLAFAQTVGLAMTHDRRALQSLLISQSMVLAAEHNVGGPETLALGETAVLAHEITRGTLQVLTLAESVATEVDHVYTASPTDTLTFAETASLRYGKEGRAGDFLVIADAVRLHHTHGWHAGDTLALTEHAARGPITWDRRAGDTLTFLDKDIPVGSPVLIDGQAVVITRPAAQLVRAARSVTLRSKKGAVVLPVPLLGDTDTSRDQVSVKRTMTGLYYTYVKTNPARVLEYDFELTRRKALELRAFLLSSHSLLVYLTNWKGEQYVGYVLNNPAQLTTTSRYARSFEKVTVTLNYEGTRVN